MRETLVEYPPPESTTGRIEFVSQNLRKEGKGKDEPGRKNEKA